MAFPINFDSMSIDTKNKMGECLSAFAVLWLVSEMETCICIGIDMGDGSYFWNCSILGGNNEMEIS